MEELKNADHISIGNWSNKTQGVSQFIEVGEGISEGVEVRKLAEVENPTNIQNNLEDQTVGKDEEDYEEEHPTIHTTMASGQVSKPPAFLINEIGEATLTAAE